MSIIPSLGGYSGRTDHAFEASLGYIVDARPATVMQQDPVSNKTKTKHSRTTRKREYLISLALSFTQLLISCLCCFCLKKAFLPSGH